MFQAGQEYKAKLVAAGVSMTLKEEPQAFMQFEISSDGQTDKFFWSGTFSEKAISYTLKALLTAGFQGNDVEDLKEYGLKMFKSVDTTVQLEDYKGKLRIRWVNAPQKAFTGATPKLAGAFAKMRQEMGIKQEPKSEPNW